MDAATFRELYALLDEVVSADPGWLDEVYAPMACPVRRDVCDEHWDFHMIDVHLDPETPPLRAAVVGLCLGNLCVVRSDILELTKPHLEFFSVGRVYRSGDELGGYACLLAGPRAHVRGAGLDRERLPRVWAALREPCAAAARPPGRHRGQAGFLRLHGASAPRV